MIVIAVAEVFSVFSFASPFEGKLWEMRTDYESGDLGFDPRKKNHATKDVCQRPHSHRVLPLWCLPLAVGLKPTDPKELAAMQTKELNNGRLAMIAMVGMVVQELASGSKLF